VFGAAAASAKLLGLDAERTAHALGIAASQSAGIVENLPSAAKNVSVGNAARNGLFSALLAEAGYTAAPAAIEGALGWGRAMGDEPDVAAAMSGLGEQWELGLNTYKPYPAGIVMHAVVDACLALRREHGLTVGQIAEVTVSGDQLLHRCQRSRCSGQHSSLCRRGVSVWQSGIVGVFRCRGPRSGGCGVASADSGSVGRWQSAGRGDGDRADP
jgi:2-methylcitrate dehydratase PrpD